MGHRSEETAEKKLVEADQQSLIDRSAKYELVYCVEDTLVVSGLESALVVATIEKQPANAHSGGRRDIFSNC